MESWDASDEGAGFDATAQADQDAQRIAEHAALREFLRDPAARRWVGRLLYNLCFLTQVTAPADFDARAAMFREGARAIGLHIHREMLQGARAEYFMLMSEHLE